MDQPQITFDQLPAYVYQLGRKFDELVSLLQAQNSQKQTYIDRWLTIEQLSDYLPGKPAITTLYGKVQRREIPFSRNGKRLTFLQSEIDQWLASGRVSAGIANLDQHLKVKARKGGRRQVS